MPNTDIYSTFFDSFQSSIADGTFAKLTLAKTIGNTQLMNIYVRNVVVDQELKLSLTFKYQTEEEVFIHTIEEAIPILISHLNNPFLSALLFTINADVKLKLNKKRVASILKQSPTFKNADPVMLSFQSGDL